MVSQLATSLMVWVILCSYNEPTETHAADSHLYKMLEIGEIVSKDEATDSAVFKMTNSSIENHFNLLKLLFKSGLGDQQLDLPRPSLDPLPPTEQANVMIYGAWTRGARCTIWNPSVALGDSEESAALFKDVGFEKEPSCLKRATDDGDCGALYLDAINGCPVAMHHALIKFYWPGTDKPDEFESYGVALQLRTYVRTYLLFIYFAYHNFQLSHWWRSALRKGKM